MEEEVKISFWKKLKISIFGLEDYKKLIVQKNSKTILYIIILMLIFTFFLTFAFTYKISQKVNIVKQYIEQNIETLEYSNGKLNITQKQNNATNVDEQLDIKIIINTSNELTTEQINQYQEEIKKYYNGIIILQDKVMLKTEISSAISTISFNDITNSINLVKIEKQDILNILSANNIYIIFYIIMFIYLFIIYLSSVLLDAVLYSFIGYIAGIFSNLRIRFKNIYNIAIHSLTLPIILNLVYMVINILTGYTIKYFDILYMTIASIYVIAAILIIRSDIIKQQIELSKIMQEQEKVRLEIEEKERQKKEQEEKEKIRKKDEKERQTEKKKKQEKDNSSKNGDTPEPQANIKPEEL